MADDLSKIREEFTPETQDNFTKLEEQRLNLAFLKSQLGRFEQETEQKKTYAKLAFRLVCGWLSIVLLILIAQGFSGCCLWSLWAGYVWGFHLDDRVLMALIGSTTANIFGVLYIVMKYLFPSK